MIATFPIRLTAREKLVDNVFRFTFAPVDHAFVFKPGQYVILHIPQADGHAVRRLYSMASPASRPGSFDLIVEIIEGGLASGYLMRMQIGETLTTQGPAGMFTLPPEPADSVFLATGTGIAPIMSMLSHLAEHHTDKQAFLFWGFPNISSVYLQDELKKIASIHPNFRFMNCLSREQDLTCVTSPAERGYFGLGHVNDGLEAVVGADIPKYHYFLCGGPKVVESLREYLAGKGVPKEQVHFEKFTG
ncbi:MAG: FAD-dependent oxidoreductase [Patescibacteria group bacterium]|nr:FAD-dependent oxidoreductase [Patescibacteria group bacterium]